MQINRMRDTKRINFMFAYVIGIKRAIMLKMYNKYVYNISKKQILRQERNRMVVKNTILSRNPHCRRLFLIPIFSRGAHYFYDFYCLFTLSKVQNSNCKISSCNFFPKKVLEKKV